MNLLQRKNLLKKELDCVNQELEKNSKKRINELEKNLKKKLAKDFAELKKLQNFKYKQKASINIDLDLDTPSFDGNDGYISGELDIKGLGREFEQSIKYENGYIQGYLDELDLRNKQLSKHIDKKTKLEKKILDIVSKELEKNQIDDWDSEEICSKLLYNTR
jgi:hypothetical protein